MMTVQSTSRYTQSTLLRRTLQVNGVSTSLMGIIMAAGAGPIASFLGLDSPLALAVIGVMLLAHGVILFIGGNREPINPGLAWYAIIGDTAWVVGSTIILLTGLLPLTTEGKWVVAIVADLVAVFAILQFYGLRRQQK